MLTHEVVGVCRVCGGFHDPANLRWCRGAWLCDACRKELAEPARDPTFDPPPVPGENGRTLDVALRSPSGDVFEAIHGVCHGCGEHANCHDLDVVGARLLCPGCVPEGSVVRHLTLADELGRHADHPTCRGSAK